MRYAHVMTVPRLKAGIFVRALIRRAEVEGAHAYVLHKGSEEAGAVTLKLLRRDGTSLVLNQARNGEGALVWVKPLGDSSEEEKSRAWFDRQTRFDPDLWIVEIEDAQGRTFVDEPIL
jgi:hypothetical protein